MWFARPRRGAPRSAVVYPQAKLPDYFRHGKFTSFQRQLNNFGFRVEKHGATKGACVYTRDDLTGQPIEALLGIQKRTVVYDAPSVNGALAGGLPPEWLHGGLGALYGLGAAGLPSGLVMRVLWATWDQTQGHGMGSDSRRRASFSFAICDARGLPS